MPFPDEIQKPSRIITATHHVPPSTTTTMASIFTSAFLWEEHSGDVTVAEAFADRSVTLDGLEAWQAMPVGEAVLDPGFIQVLLRLKLLPPRILDAILASEEALRVARAALNNPGIRRATLQDERACSHGLSEFGPAYLVLTGPLCTPDDAVLDYSERVRDCQSTVVLARNRREAIEIMAAHCATDYVVRAVLSEFELEALSWILRATRHGYRALRPIDHA